MPVSTLIKLYIFNICRLFFFFHQPYLSEADLYKDQQEPRGEGTLEKERFGATEKGDITYLSDF